MSKLAVHYKVAYDFFILVRNPSNAPGARYGGEADFAVEILDSNHTSVARELFRKDLESPEPPSKGSARKFLHGIVTFDLPTGTYSIVTDIKDLESSRRYFDNTRTILLKDFQSGSVSLSDLLFAEPLNTSVDSLDHLKIGRASCRERVCQYV